MVQTQIDKVIHSLGSDKLTNIIEEVCDRENTPATFIIRHGILMWYNKNLQIDNIADKINSNEFSKTAQEIMKYRVVNHCSLHAIAYKDVQKIELKLNIPRNFLMSGRKDIN